MNRNEERALEARVKKIEEEKKGAMIANIIEELEHYDHELSPLTVVYLVLKKMRINNREEVAAVK